MVTVIWLCEGMAYNYRKFEEQFCTERMKQLLDLFIKQKNIKLWKLIYRDFFRRTDECFSRRKYSHHKFLLSIFSRNEWSVLDSEWNLRAIRPVSLATEKG